MPASTVADVVLAIWGEENVPLSVGEVPAGFPLELVPPEPVQVIGGATSHGHVIAAFRYPPGDHDVVAGYAELAQTSGWLRDASRMGSPFGHSGFVMFLKNQTALTFRGGSPSATGTVVVVSRGPEGGAPDFSTHRGRPDFGELTVPHMDPLPNARFVDGGGGGGGGDHFTQEARLITSTPTPDIAQHYTRQLESHGWTAGERWDGADGSIQRLSARDARGRAWSGMLSAAHSGPTIEMFIHMSLVGTTRG